MVARLEADLLEQQLSSGSDDERAAELPEDRRQAFLDETCGDDGDLRDQAKAILDSLSSGVILLDRGRPGEWLTAEISGGYGTDLSATVVGEA